MKNLLTVIALTACQGLTLGCGTIVGRQYPSLRAEPDTSYYPATWFDASLVVNGAAGFSSRPSDRAGGHIPHPAEGLIMVLTGILDLPVSLVTDTVLLPLDSVRVPAEKERLSRVFDMAIGTQTAKAPGMILLDTSCLHGPNPPESAPWATFLESSSGRVVKVTWPEPFVCGDSPDRYRLYCVSRDGVSVERLKRRDLKR